MSTTKVPDIWKTANVVAIHKKGLKNTPKNLRPISLTCPSCRTMEDIIRNNITTHLDLNNILSSHQHGFVKGRSTLTQQLIMMNILTSNLENKIPTDMIFLDFAKAFDSVPHGKLLYVLNEIKLDKQIINWITEYITNRTQKTVIDGHFSESCQISSGVPQGSVVGTTLFLIYINDLLETIDKNCNVTLFAFADDVKFLSTQPNLLQEALDQVNIWSRKWQIKIQPSKSEHMHFKNNKTLSNLITNFSMNGEIIKTTSATRDLGIILSDDLKWSHQISKVYTKAMRLCYTVIRSFKTNNSSVYISIYKTHIRPIIEFNSCIWNPHLKTDIRKLESIQKIFTRLLFQKLNLHFDSYRHRLDILHLETLEQRRLKLDMIIAYKLNNNLLNLEPYISFSQNNLKEQYNLRRHNKLLKPPPLTKSLIRSNYFINRIIPIWNKLPQDLVSSQGLIEFKNKIKLIDISQYKDFVF